MLPAGPLMVEHRLIERMVAVMSKEEERIRSTGIGDTILLATVIDFMRTYADRCHHGKEENILFKELQPKGLRPEDRKMMEKLIEDHRIARGLVGELQAAVVEYSSGNANASLNIAEVLDKLTHLYPAHIALEDKEFFPRSMDYLSDMDREKMLAEFREFDRQMIHERYRGAVESAEKSFPSGGGRL